MRCLKMIAVILVPLMLSLTGCGSDSSGTTSANNPFTTSGGNTSGGNTSGGSGGTIFGNISTATGSTGIFLTTDISTVDVNNGQVLAIARLVSGGVPVSGAPVTFSIIAPTNGPATIEAGLTTVTTDSNGVAVTRITTGNVLTTTSVIVQATATLPGGQTATVNTTFQIVRGGGVIMFTSAAGATPGSQINQLPDVEKTVFPTIPVVTFLQQLPFKVTDSNGNPRVGVPVTLSIFSETGASLLLFIENPTVTTDSAGQGIFNVTVTLTTPPSGSFTSASAIYQAVTNDTIPVTAYIGGTYSLTSLTLSLLDISPSFASFGTTTAITFTVSGGSPPYTVASSNTALVTATLSGNTVTALLVDTTAWTGFVTITVTDSASNSASASVSR